MRTIKKNGLTIKVLQTPKEARKFVNAFHSLLNGTPALDFETTALRPDDSDDAQVRLTAIATDSETAYVIDHWLCGSFASFCDDLVEKGPYYVFNVNFEGRWFEYEYSGEAVTALTRCLYDVAHMRRSVMGGGPWSLASMVKRDLKIELDKSLQNSGWSNKELTDKQYFYGGADAIYTKHLGDYWAEEMDDARWNGFFVINDAWRAVNECEDTGLLLDERHHEKLIEMWHKRRDAAEAAFRKYVPADVVPNMRSKKQMSDFLKSILDDEAIASWPATEKTGQLSTTRNVLRSMSFISPYPLSRALACYMVYTRADKYIGTYGETLLTKQRLSRDGRIHGRLNMAAAITGRFSSCCAPETLVRTAYGQVEIKNLRPGMKVLTHRGRYMPVTAVGIKGAEDMLTFSLSNGRKISVTPNHRFLVKGKWVKAKTLKVGDGIAAGFGNFVSVEVGHDYGTGAKAASHTPFGSEEVCAGSNDRGRIPAGQEQELFAVEDRKPEPDADKSARSGAVRGREGVSHDTVQGRQEALCASSENGRGAGVAGTAGRMGRASSGRGHAQQRVGQSGAGNGGCAQETARGFEGVCGEATITAIYRRANVEVWDCTVEEDHSYCSEGVFSHNSNPNMQNFPRHPLFRFGFIAGRGRKLILADYSGVEIRVLAEVSGDKILLHDAIYDDVHSRSAIAIYQIADADEFIRVLKSKDPADKAAKARAKEMRAKAKTFTFQLLYGAGAGALAIALRCTPDEAQDAVNKWAARYQKAYHYRQIMYEKMMHTGFMPCASGRTIFVPKWDRSMPVAANYPIQGSAGDVMYRAMYRTQELLDQADISARLMVSVHDELLLLSEDDCADEAKEILEKGMLAGWLDIFEGSNTDNLADVVIGDRWSDKA